MIKKNENLAVDIITNMKGGEGQVVKTAFATKEELLNKARLFANLHLDPHCGIGYHTHEGENEIFYIANGEAIYNDNGTEVVVKQGDVCVCNPGESHGIRTEDSSCDIIANIVLV